MIEQKLYADGVIAAVAMSTPMWVEHITTYGGLVMLFGGIVLLALRILLSWKEWKKPNG